MGRGPVQRREARGLQGLKPHRAPIVNVAAEAATYKDRGSPFADSTQGEGFEKATQGKPLENTAQDKSFGYRARRKNPSRIALRAGRSSRSDGNERSDSRGGFYSARASDSFYAGDIFSSRLLRRLRQQDRRFHKAVRALLRRDSLRRPSFEIPRRLPRKRLHRPLRFKRRKKRRLWWRARCIAWSFQIAAAWCVVGSLKNI